MMLRFNMYKWTKRTTNNPTGMMGIILLLLLLASPPVLYGCRRSMLVLRRSTNGRAGGGGTKGAGVDDMALATLFSGWSDILDASGTDNEVFRRYCFLVGWGVGDYEASVRMAFLQHAPKAIIPIASNSHFPMLDGPETCPGRRSRARGRSWHERNPKTTITRPCALPG
jgi:hypothetical protein